MEEKFNLSAEELAEFRAFQEAKQRRSNRESRREQIRTYKEMVDKEVRSAIEVLFELSEQMASIKKITYENFQSILELKDELGKVDPEQRSHQFQSLDGQYRITLGFHMRDNYQDSVDLGISKVMEYLESLVDIKNRDAMIGIIRDLTSKTKSGNIPASKLIKLRQRADESGNETFIEGVRIIEDAYSPVASKK